MVHWDDGFRGRGMMAQYGLMSFVMTAAPSLWSVTGVLLTPQLKRACSGVALEAITGDTVSVPLKFQRDRLAPGTVGDADHPRRRGLPVQETLCIRARRRHVQIGAVGEALGRAVAMPGPRDLAKIALNLWSDRF